MTTLRTFARSTAQLSLVAVAGCALLTTGCGTVDDSASSYDSMRLVEISQNSTCVPFFAGQSIDVGTVCVTIDNEVDTAAECGADSTGAMTVTYALTGGWELVETHLAVGDMLSDIPSNKKGNPKIGNFPYASGDITGATTHEVSVPLCTVGLDGAQTSCDPVNSYLAAHAAVRHDNGDGTYQTETAWGDGERMVQKGSWAEYFNMELSCTEAPEEPPPPPAVTTCETAFALAGDGTETCFIGADFDGDGADDGINRWGWSNGPLAPGSSREWPVYAAAGQCNLGNGELVGHLSVDYDGTTAQIAFDRVSDFVLEEEQLYVGSEPLPRNNQGEYTVAPGQYPIVIDLDDDAHTTNSVDGLAGDIYIVYHAVACGTYTDDSNNGGGGDDGGGDGGTTDGGGDGGTTDGGGDGGGGVCDGDPLAAMSDEFDGDLSAWDVHRPEDAAYSVTGGQLVMEPLGNTQWYANDQALHVNQTVTGNFAMTAQVEVTNLAGGPTVPGDPYRIGGLMMRDPMSTTEVNSYHLGIGNMNTGSINIASKSTDDSMSTIGVQNWNGTTAELRICRVGDDVQGLIRLPGQAWSMIDWHVRSDLPETVVTGPIAYAGTPVPDLRVSCDYVHYMPVETLGDCMKDLC